MPDGEVGEVVVTGFNPAYPLVRLGTGDLSAVLPGLSPCGRTNTRIKGWMGRADQRTKVKGMFVDPRQVAEIVRRHPEIAKARLVVSRDGEARRDGAACRAGRSGARRTSTAIEATLRDVTKLGGDGCRPSRPAACPTTARSSPTSATTAALDCRGSSALVFRLHRQFRV